MFYRRCIEKEGERERERYIRGTREKGECDKEVFSERAAGSDLRTPNERITLGMEWMVFLGQWLRLGRNGNREFDSVNPRGSSPDGIRADRAILRNQQSAGFREQNASRDCASHPSNSVAAATRVIENPSRSRNSQGVRAPLSTRYTKNPIIMNPMMSFVCTTGKQIPRRQSA